MSDPIKKFVKDNRQEFDHLEPSDAVLQRVIAMQRNNAPKERTARKLYDHRKWWVAASIIVISFSALYIGTLNDGQTDSAEPTVVIQQPPAPIKPAPIDLVNKDPEENAAEKTPPSIAHKEQKSNPSLQASRSGNRERILAGLKNMHSTSERLHATIEARKFSQEDELVMDALELTLNNDPSSNVRLAALETMSKFYQNDDIPTKLRSALMSQDDPLVQAELINLLSSVEGLGIQDELVALANNPNTVSIVKDEAYTALIHHKNDSERFH